MSKAFYLERMEAAKQADIERRKANGWSVTDHGAGRYTIGDSCSAVFAIDNDEDAKRFYEGYVEWLREQSDLDEKGPEHVAKANIGWFFGEGMSDERRAMWVRVTGAAHPIFGANLPSPEEAFEAGRRAGAAK